ncbi:MAG: serine hydrolase [Thermoanaerobaculia bacterium]
MIDDELERLHIPGAAVAVLEDGELVWARGFGFADLEQTVEVQPDTPFMIGSTSKVFIGLAVLQLMERGKLQLEDPAAKYLPELGDAYSEVTLRQLLSHTAGIPRDAKRRGPPPYVNHQLYGDELLEFLAKSNPEFAAGSRARYSNLGPALLAIIVERSSGGPIEDYLQTAVFEPAGMSRSGLFKKTDDPGKVEAMAAGTVWTGSRPRAAGHESRFPTGSIYSTALDLAAFMEALEGGELIRRDTLEAAWTVQMLTNGQKAILGRDGIGREYGGALGWFVHEADGKDIVHHGGSMEGFSSEIDIDRHSRRTVIVLGNNEAGPAGDLAWALLDHSTAGRDDVAREAALAALLEEVPFDSDRWHIEAAQSRVVQHQGRTSLYLRDGTAWVEDVEFTDGVVEFDIAFTDERGFMGMLWRLQDADNYEEFYVRPHQSGNPDANQYTPASDGLTSWQLYHGPGYNAPVEYRYDEWNRIRVVVSGRQAEVYINDMRRPALFIREQKRAVRAGRIGLNAFSAPAHFSAFRFHAGEPPAFRSLPPPPRQAVEGTIMTWEVGATFDWATLRDEIELPAQMAQAQSWRKLSSESSGLANLSQVVARGEGKNAVFARVTIDSLRAQTVGMRFGYSDLVRVYLNGQAIYAGDNRYRSRDYRYLGTIGFFDEVFLALRPGENQLWFAVAEDFGGWGLQAILDSAEGITVRPPDR